MLCLSSTVRWRRFSVVWIRSRRLDLCIYLATDSEEVKQAMRTRYGERIVCAESKADRSTTEGIREGIADLWTLAHTRKIYGSFHSSFSELAAELGRIPLVVVKR